nr:hypothetical protein [Opitutales bacterium]
NQHVLNYHYEVDYRIGKNKRTVKSQNFKLNIVNRYVVGFECNRGKPYSKISLLGRGFIDGDHVVIGGCPCETTFVSPNVLTFIVPFIENGGSYKAILDSENGDIGLGEFLVDPLMITVSPAEIDLSTQDKQVLTISIDIDAPEAGLPLDITTNIPDSVIMHEVSIRPGMRFVRAVIEGGVPGKGSLFISAPGFSERVVPITVRGDDNLIEIEGVGNSEYSSLTDLNNGVILEE